MIGLLKLGNINLNIMYDLWFDISILLGVIVVATKDIVKKKDVAPQVVWSKIFTGDNYNGSG